MNQDFLRSAPPTEGEDIHILAKEKPADFEE